MKPTITRPAVLSFAILAVVAMLSADAMACGRCGLFGRRCRFQSHAVVEPVLVQEAAYPAPTQQTITIQNNYNAPGLASPIAAQGATVYGYSTAALAYQVDPNAILQTAARLTENAQNLAAEGFTGYKETAQLSLSNQADVQKILAATAHLKAAAVGQSSTQSVKVEIKPGQKPKVTTNPPSGDAGSVPAVFSRSCLKCHSGPAPKGKFSLEGPTYDPATITKSLRAIATGHMPPADSAIVLSNEDKGAIMQFLLSRDQSAKEEKK